MKHCAGLLVLLALAACEPAAVPSGAPRSVKSAIIGGVAEPSHWYVVMVGDAQGGSCTGTLLSRRTVITAGHCRFGNNSLSRVYFDTGNPLLRTSVLATSSVRHPQYAGASENDLALVQLAQDAPLQAVPLLRETMTNGLPWIGPKYTFVGFGDTNASGQGFGTRRVVTFPISLIGPSPVTHPGPVPFGSPTSIDGSEWYYRVSNKNTCFGDSGGPAFVVRNGVERHAGATSFGDDDCAYDGVQAKTDATTLAWIQQTIDLWEGAADPCKSDGVCGPGCVTTLPAPRGTLKDPDCADQHCGADGVCVLSCAVVDADCAGLSINDCTENGICQPNCLPADTDCAAGTAPVGTACSLGGECASGFCSNNVCCDSACKGACEACASNGSCAPKAAGLPCRPSAGTCDLLESCTGIAGQCPADLFAPTNLPCRASAGPCDVAETCSGTAAICPVDSFEPNTAVCRAGTGPCDAPEHCTSGSPLCPQDRLRAQGEICRFEAGSCDIPEACDGVSLGCPADAVAQPGSLCRAAAGNCDLPEVCTGAADCPQNAVAAMGVACRLASNVCDAPEACTGSSDLCPADKPAPTGLPCLGGTCAAGLCLVVSAPFDAGQPMPEDSGRAVPDAGGTAAAPRGCGCSAGGQWLFALAAVPMFLRRPTRTRRARGDRPT